MNIVKKGEERLGALIGFLGSRIARKLEPLIISVCNKKVSKLLIITICAIVLPFGGIAICDVGQSLIENSRKEISSDTQFIITIHNGRPTIEQIKTRK